MTRWQLPAGPRTNKHGNQGKSGTGPGSSSSSNADAIIPSCIRFTMVSLYHMHSYNDVLILTTCTSTTKYSYWVTLGPSVLHARLLLARGPCCLLATSRGPVVGMLLVLMPRRRSR